MGALPKSELFTCFQKEDLGCIGVATDIWGIAHRRAVEACEWLQAENSRVLSLRDLPRWVFSDMFCASSNPKIWVGFSAIFDQTRLGNVVVNRSYPLLGQLALAVLPYGHVPQSCSAVRPFPLELDTTMSFGYWSSPQLYEPLAAVSWKFFISTGMLAY